MRNIYFTFLLLFIFTSCEDNNDDSSGLSPSNEDSQGNLVLSNYSDYELVLYSGMDRIKILPASVEDFLVLYSTPTYGTLSFADGVLTASENIKIIYSPNTLLVPLYLYLRGL